MIAKCPIAKTWAPRLVPEGLVWTAGNAEQQDEVGAMLALC